MLQKHHHEEGEAAGGLREEEGWAVGMMSCPHAAVTRTGPWLRGMLGSVHGAHEAVRASAIRMIDLQLWVLRWAFSIGTSQPEMTRAPCSLQEHTALLQQCQPD